MSDENTIKTVRKAIQWLAAECDGAQSRDGMGFSGVDTSLGHALTHKEVWSDEEALTAGALAKKYRGQLGAAGIRISGIDDIDRRLKEKVGKHANRLSAKDVVQGKIWVSGDQIHIRATYREEVVARVRNLIGRKYDGETHTWSCSLCSENAHDVETISNDFGIPLIKHDGWSDLKATRSLLVEGNQIIVEGVNAHMLSRRAKQIGDPARDEMALGAWQMLSQTRAMYPLRSWLISPELARAEAMDESDPLHWAKKDIVSALTAASVGAAMQEHEHALAATALALSADAAERVRDALPASVADRLMPHQFVAVEAALKHRHLLFADEQGLGKTIEVLASLEATASWPAVVLVPAAAALKWAAESRTLLPLRRVAVRGGGVGKRDQGCDLHEADLVVINYESFAQHSAALAGIHPMALVADEAQYLKGYDSARTKAVKEFLGKAGVPRVIAATGTPVMNRPAELLTLLTVLPDLLSSLGGFVYFAARYCCATLRTTTWASYWDYTGAANLEELAVRLPASGGFIRRQKSEVLPSLPKKRHETLQVQLSNAHEYEHAVADFRSWLNTRPLKQKRSRGRGRSGDVDGGEVEGSSAALTWINDVADIDADRLYPDDKQEALRRIAALRQLTGEGKVSAAADLMCKIAGEEKVVVFAHHIAVQNALLAKAVAEGIKAVSITGAQAARARANAIQAFQTQDDVRAIVCSLKAAQTAIDLFASRRALFSELDWTPASLAQAEDRLHRIGQTREVIVTYLTAPGTLDERMLELLDEKREIIRKLSGDSD